MINSQASPANSPSGLPEASAAVRTEVIGDATLYLGDCRDLLAGLGRFGAVVTDPPYGIAFSHGGNDRSGIGKGKYATAFANVSIVGDEVPFDPSLLFSLSETLIIWGANHFADRLPASPEWLIWDKRAASHHTNDFADCELAWSSSKGVARVFRHQWDGMMRASERGIPRVHPTQKPVELMKWCVARTSGTVIDPFMGAGSTGVACAMLGRPFVGVEIEPAYFDAACERIAEAYRQPRLFDEPAPKPIQLELIGGDPC
jgi:site-specific DNA-methyltransferase (adenine-specific)